MENPHVIVIRSAPRANADKYRRPVNIYLIDRRETGGKIPAAVRSDCVGLVAAWRNVDSRYDGPRSAYGKAFREATAEMNRLNIRNTPMLPTTDSEINGLEPELSKN